MLGFLFFPFTIVGLIMAIVALTKMTRDDANYGLALSAFIVGLVYFIIGGLFLVFFISLLAGF